VLADLRLSARAPRGAYSPKVSLCSRVVDAFGRRDAGYDHTAESLETAQERQTKLLGLSIADREVILSVLVDPPEQLCELRAVLLQEHASRQREGF
jgi:hypothetical protein